VQCGEETVAKGCSLQEVFEAGFDSYARERSLHARELRAARCIRGCYTAAMGGHIESCPAGDYEHRQYHACRHRSCPRCAEAARVKWIDAELQRLLPCAHFHVVFTLPHSLLALWERNRAWFIKRLFDSARESLLQLLADPRRLGALPGLLMSLHTWGRNLSHHPHVHCLVSAGGLDERGQWRSTKPGWLVPVRPLQKLYRGKLLDAVWRALQARELSLPPWTTEDDWRTQIKRLYRSHWNVEIAPPYEHGRGVVLYLARYAKGGPLPADRPLRRRRQQVEFDYTDHRDGRAKTLRLAQDAFIARVLWHAPPRGVHTTRHAGLYSTSARAQHAVAAAALAAASCTPNAWPRPSPAASPSAAAKPPRRCPNCGGPLLRAGYFRPSRPDACHMHQEGEISLSVPVRATGPPPTPPPPSCRRGPTRRSSGHPTAGPTKRRGLSAVSRGLLSAAA
jgi:Putative transposase/Transposase zinc-binding domain